MKKISLLSIFILLASFSSYSQNKYKKLKEDESKNIVAIIDELTVSWDTEAANLKTYEGLKSYCRTKPYRDKMVGLLDKIHHYDTSLYMIVNAKYYDKQDPQAEATLKDIEELEKDYTTRSFLKFLHLECNTLNDIERNTGKEKDATYNKEVKRLEKELVRYVDEITRQIDLIDEHVHHLNELN